MSRPCARCGTPIPRASYCAECAPVEQRISARERGYGTSWDKLSKRARRLQPFCGICGSVENLQCDHTPAAWQRQAEGKSIRLADVRVLCGPCNRAAGAARGNAVTRGDVPSGAVRDSAVRHGER